MKEHDIMRGITHEDMQALINSDVNVHPRKRHMSILMRYVDGKIWYKAADKAIYYYHGSGPQGNSRYRDHGRAPRAESRQVRHMPNQTRPALAPHRGRSPAPYRP